MNRFGRIDALVNNAGNFYAGFFEEISPEDFRAQIETNLFGPVNVTRAVLPVMRAQRRGLIVTISSTGGISEVARCVDRRLRREDQGDRHRLEDNERITRRRPREARQGDDHTRGQRPAPLRWPAGADAVETFEKKANDLVAQASAHRALSSSLAHDNASK
jgi:NAD(P)-dependent dehydrogenase (short-subunit alcohol dehydrogenase family)